MATRLVQDTNIHNKKKKKSIIIFEMCQIQKKWHSPVRFDSILFSYIVKDIKNVLNCKNSWNIMILLTNF
jgi:hypothetical protein